MTWEEVKKKAEEMGIPDEAVAYVGDWPVNELFWPRYCRTPQFYLLSSEPEENES